MVAAKWMGVPPWELYDQPAHWRDRALMLMSDQDWAEVEMMKRQRHRGN